MALIGGWLCVASLAAVVPFAVWVVRDGNANDRRKREIMGCCRDCGYDLRASGERCPECGRARVRHRSSV